MVRSSMRLAAAVLGAALGGASASASDTVANPIRKVVNLLQEMQRKVTEEGEKEKALHDKFMCYCSSGTGDLDASLSAADAKIKSLGTEIEAAVQKKAKTEADLKQHQADREAAITAMKEATAIREKEAAAYAAVKAEHGANAAALAKAIKALEKGMAGAFLQSYSADILRKLTSHSRDIGDEDRKTLAAFLSSTSGDAYAPQSGEITGILKTIQDEMHAGFADATATEEAAVKSYEELMATRTKEKEVLSQSIETKTARVGELGVSIAEMKNDKEDTEEALAADQKFLLELKKSCATKTADWEERSKTRAEELVALADTIKVLNDDEALDLFKSTLAGSASLLEVGAGKAGARAAALAAVRQAAETVSKAERPRLDVIMLALHGKKVGFEKVIAMIDKMVQTLKTEQTDDDQKLTYCNTQLDTSDDKKKEFERKISDRETDMANAQEAVSTLTEEIAGLKAGLKALDKSVAEAGETRKKEHEEFKNLMASNSAAKEVLEFAKNRLNKFYNPKLFKAAPKQELSAEDRIASGMKAFVQISAHVHHGEAPPPPPETYGAYSKKSQESTGVMEMINLLVKDLDKEMTVAETQEKDAQGDYEALMADSAEKRAADSKSLSEKEGAKANTEAALERHTDDRDAAAKELGATVEYIASLHSDCDFILQYHGARQEARASEVDALGRAKAVLSGADFALLQQGAARGALRGSK